MSRPPKRVSEVQPALPPSSFTTEAQAKFRLGSTKRTLWAAIGALCVVVILLLLSPEYDPQKDPLAHYGAPGEMVIMQQVSIQDGRDQTHQLPKSLQVPPPPARMEIEKEETSPEGSVPVPQETEATPNEVITTVTSINPDAEVSSKNLVELNMPIQSNPDLFLLQHQNPEYPLDATDGDRRIPSIYVLVAAFVNPDGEVTDVMVMTNTGSRVFADAVVEKVKEWKFGWRVPQKVGRWAKVVYNFNSPYFSSGQG